MSTKTLKQFLSYYISNGGSVYYTFRDATKTHRGADGLTWWSPSQVLATKRCMCSVHVRTCVWCVCVRVCIVYYLF